MQVANAAEALPQVGTYWTGLHAHLLTNALAQHVKYTSDHDKESSWHEACSHSVGVLIKSDTPSL